MIYKAFVSSTFEDLKQHRKEVIRALRKAGIFVDPMEDWTAASDEPKEFSQDRTRDCNLCLLLVAFRRGHVPEGEALSITQLEYQAAVDLGIDVLVFMLDEESPWPRKFDELDKDPEIMRWRAELKEHKGVGFFGLEPTSIEIAPALTRWIAEKQQSAREAQPSKPNPVDEPVVLVAEEETVTFAELLRSLQHDVVKVHAHTHMLGVAAEYEWIRRKYPGSKTLRQALTTLDLITGKSKYKDDQIHFDVITIRLPDGREKEIYFDVSSFFGGGVSSILDPHASISRKIAKLYESQPESGQGHRQK